MGGCNVTREMKTTGLPHNILLDAGYVVKIGGTQVLGAQGAVVADAAAATAVAGTDGSLGTPSEAGDLVEITASYVEADIANNFATLAAQIEALRVDAAALRTALNASLARQRAHGLIATAS